MNEKTRKILIALVAIAALIVAFYLGQRSQGGVSIKKKVQAKKVLQARAERKKTLPVVAAPSVAAAPVTSRASKGARVAIVIDDFGYSTNNLPAFFDINRPLTFSILPNLPYSREVAERAKEHGDEVILHLPMESHRKGAAEEPGTLMVGESRKDVVAQLAKDIISVPGLKGVSNHQGSKGTEDKELMTEVLTYLKKHNLYFFDSLTSDKSVCHEVADKIGLPFAKRDIFLDNSNDVEKIGIELDDLENLALKRGHAIAICHDRKNTAIALAKAMPRMARDGIEFVYLSEMAR